MFSREDILNIHNQYTEAEMLYKALYHAKSEKKRLSQFISSQPLAKQEMIANWLKAEKGEILTEFTENTLELDFSDNIIVSYHSRYCPAFIHKHTFFEIIVVLKGKCINRINKQDNLLEEGDICIIAPGNYHALFESSDSIIYNILIKHYNFSDVFNSFLLRSSLLSSFFMQSLYSKIYTPSITFHAKDDIHLQQIIDILILENINKEGKCIGNLCESLTNTIFNYLELRHIEMPKSTDSRFILELKHYIGENMKDACLTSLANEFNYSPTYLSKLVNKLTGSNVSNIIRRVRIDKACNLLSCTNLSVREISEITGYNSTRQFNRAFYSLIKKTPTEYRQKKESLLI